MTTAEAYLLIRSCWPQGAENHYDLSPTGDPYKFLYAQAGLVADQQGQIDTLRAELNPATMTQKIPDWEVACGLTQTKIAKFGTTAQRRAQVLAVLRSFGSSFSLPEIRAICQPFLGYADPSQIQILETDRATLDNLHTYSDATGYVLAMGVVSNSISTFTVADDSAVSPAGARIYLNLTGYLQDLSFDAYGPGGQHRHWTQGYLGTGSVTNQDYWLYAPDLAGVPIMGNWTITVTCDGTHAATVNIVSIIVEGIGRDATGGSGLGSAIYEWAVVVDPALVSPTADLPGLLAVLRRVCPAHTAPYVVVKNSVVGGGLAAIPDDPVTIPDACVPGT